MPVNVDQSHGASCRTGYQSGPPSLISRCSTDNGAQGLRPTCEGRKDRHAQASADEEVVPAIMRERRLVNVQHVN